VIQQKIENGLAERLLRGRIREGDHVVVSGQGKSFDFQVERSADEEDGQPAGAGAEGDIVEGEIVE
jgi:hypothetical protein